MKLLLIALLPSYVSSQRYFWITDACTPADCEAERVASVHNHYCVEVRPTGLPKATKSETECRKIPKPEAPFCKKNSPYCKWEYGWNAFIGGKCATPHTVAETSEKIWPTSLLCDYPLQCVASKIATFLDLCASSRCCRECLWFTTRGDACGSSPENHAPYLNKIDQRSAAVAIGMGITLKNTESPALNGWSTLNLARVHRILRNPQSYQHQILQNPQIYQNRMILDLLKLVAQ